MTLRARRSKFRFQQMQEISPELQTHINTTLRTTSRRSPVTFKTMPFGYRGTLDTKVLFPSWFLDIDIYRKKDGSLGHKVYRKPIHTNLYLHQKSHHHPANKNSVLTSLTHRAKALWDPESLAPELTLLTDVFFHYGYSQQQIQQAMKTVTRTKKTEEEAESISTAYLPYTQTTYGNSAGCWQNSR
jgi:hypothetical protein